MAAVSFHRLLARAAQQSQSLPSRDREGAVYPRFVAALLAVALGARADQFAESKTSGLEAARRGDLASAADSLGKACDLQPSDEDACYFLARTLYTLQRYELATPAFERALKAATPETRERAARGAALNMAALDRPVESERLFRQAVAARADTGEDSRIDYGAFLTRQGRATEALVLLEQAVKADPPPARALVALGRALLHLDRVAEAAARLEQAVRANPKLADAHLLLGRAYLRLGLREEGERELRYGSSTTR